ncbi:hypothetical protein [Actinomadura oligospora]|uniref:hypothetical protein n=1 Tax=Actinomadura oligospora TaxID=111804 RepID=UPI0012FA6833|nr:hypothetical protein [Actinomadura oligospora]
MRVTLIVPLAAAALTGGLLSAPPASAGGSVTAPGDVTAQQCRDGGGTVLPTPYFAYCVGGTYNGQRVTG